MAPYAYESYRSNRPPQHKHSKKLKLLFFATCLVVCLFAFHFVHGYFHKAHALHKTSAQINSTNLSAKVNPIIAQNSQYQISVAAIDPSTGQTFQAGLSSPFVAASTTKVLSGICWLRQVEAGVQSLNEPMGDYNAQFELQEMINDSDNDAWALINSELGNDLNNCASDLGITSFNTSDNTITAADDAKLLAGLYTGKDLNRTDTSLLLSYMQGTNNQDMLPAALPNYTVYNKYGELNGELHDTGIITNDHDSLVLSIYTNNAGTDAGTQADYTARVNLIKQIAQTIASSYFNNGS